ncbi:hypothetical protein ACFFX0_21440 [Citricoccus parietis]|uniref:Uncharacterized protein n=1 Tax=Citricoccus parietis TaxID=592307 RepID=A0ABV5G3V4_9MICC
MTAPGRSPRRPAGRRSRCPARTGARCRRRGGRSPPPGAVGRGCPEPESGWCGYLGGSDRSDRPGPSARWSWGLSYCPFVDEVSLT